mmetsp:Transcript_97399/g.192953  ORF Transcript_97399/g.192953 Transcript_97399/m.192953 type:complete len:208 (-) Transcript_97399:729-1352(-)
MLMNSMSSVPTRTTCVKKQQLQAKVINLARLWFFLANLFISSMCLKKPTNSRMSMSPDWFLSISPRIFSVASLLAGSPHETSARTSSSRSMLPLASASISRKAFSKRLTGICSDSSDPWLWLHSIAFLRLGTCTPTSVSPRDAAFPSSWVPLRLLWWLLWSTETASPFSSWGSTIVTRGFLEARCCMSCSSSVFAALSFSKRPPDCR